jgi:hypothetical protein
MKQACLSQGATTLMASRHRCTFAVPLTLMLAINACDIVLADGPAQADPLILSDHDARLDRPPMERRPSGIAASCSGTYVFGGYGWEDGEGNIFGYFSPFGSCQGEPWAGQNIHAANVGEGDGPGPHSGAHMLKITEEPHCNSTPQVHVAFIENLTDGDVIYGSFHAYDDVPDGHPSVRIWAHYATTGDPASFHGAAGGNLSFTSGIGWEQLDHTWVFDSNNGTRDALMIHVRVYSTPPDCGDCSTDYFIDDIYVEVCAASPNVTITFPDGSVFGGTGSDPFSCDGYCGGQAPGECWCDEACGSFGDCCDDVCDECPDLEFCDPGIDPYTCDGYCGGQAPGGCWCDEWCCEFSDCCDDQFSVCSKCDPDPADFYSCFGRCGEQAPSGCWCDSDCNAKGNCCDDRCESCGIPAGCAGRSCPGDFNGDHTVNISDLLLLFDLWGTCENDDSCFADLNGDGIVNLSDLLILFDQWGDCPPLSCFDSITLPLSPDGTLEWPDWTDELNLGAPFVINPVHFSGKIVIEQEPLPGTVVSGVQTVPSSITVTGTEGGEATCQVLVNVIDVSSPVIEIAGIDPNEQYIAPNCPAPVITAHDAVDENPEITALLNGEPYISGTPITEPGYYLLRATAIDSSGNIGETAVLIECREYPLHQAALVVDDFTCDLSDGYFAVSATVLLGATEFDTYDVNLWSIDLSLLDEDGFHLYRDVIPIANSLDAEGYYDYTTVAASYLNGVWYMAFEVELLGEDVASQCPSIIRITGTGNRGEPDEFDLEASTGDLSGSDDPFEKMCGQQCPGCCNAEGELPPPAEPNCACKWKQEITLTEDSDPDADADSTWTCSWSGTAKVNSKGGVPSGEGSATSNCIKAHREIRAWTSSTALLVLKLEGPRNCCDPRIEVDANPMFTTTVSRNRTGSADAAAILDVEGIAMAKGGTSISSDAPVGTTILRGPIIIHYDTSTTLLSHTKVYSDPESESVEDKVSKWDLRVTGTGIVGVQAWWHAWHGRGTVKAKIIGASPNVTMTGTCQSGPCAGQSSILRYH